MAAMADDTEEGSDQTLPPSHHPYSTAVPTQSSGTIQRLRRTMYLSARALVGRGRPRRDAGPQQQKLAFKKLTGRQEEKQADLDGSRSHDKGDRKMRRSGNHNDDAAADDGIMAAINAMPTPTMLESLLCQIVTKPQVVDGAVETKRFIPQLDLEMLGGSVRRVEEELQRQPQNAQLIVLPKPAPPWHPIMVGSVAYCAVCQLSWLRGQGQGLANRADVHPFHNAVERVEPGTSLRSVVVFIDGGIVNHGEGKHGRGKGPGKGKSHEDEKDGSAQGTTAFVIRLHFGRASKYNVSESVDSKHEQQHEQQQQQQHEQQLSRQVAELTAAVRALEVVRTRVLPDRRTAINTHLMTQYVSSQFSTGLSSSPTTMSGPALGSTSQVCFDMTAGSSSSQVGLDSVGYCWPASRSDVRSIFSTATLVNDEWGRPGWGRWKRNTFSIADSSTNPSASVATGFKAAPARASTIPTSPSPAAAAAAAAAGDSPSGPDVAGGYTDCEDDDGWLPSYGAEIPFRLIVATDSTYLVNNVCDNFDGWRLDRATRVLRSKRGHAIKNGTLFLAVHDELCKLRDMGVVVKWYHVPRGSPRGQGTGG